MSGVRPEDIIALIEQHQDMHGANSGLLLQAIAYALLHHAEATRAAGRVPATMPAPPVPAVTAMTTVSVEIINSAGTVLASWNAILTSVGQPLDWTPPTNALHGAHKLRIRRLS